MSTFRLTNKKYAYRCWSIGVFFIILSFGQKQIFADISVKNTEISSKPLEISVEIWYNTITTNLARFVMVSYNKLWKRLIDLNMKKKELKEITGIGSTTLTKLSNDEPVSMDVMIKICSALKCNIGDVMDVIV